MRWVLALGALLSVVAAGAGAASSVRDTPSPAQVVRAWSRNLNANRNADAARLFAPDAEVIQGPLDARLSSRALAIAFNDSLPCSGRIVRLTVHGTHVTATFVLGQRPRHHCTGPGTKAAALFFVVGGKITRWEEIAVPAAPTSKGPIA